MAKPKVPRPSSLEDLDAFLSKFEGRSELLGLLFEVGSLGKIHKREKISDSARTLELIRILVEKIDEGDLPLEDWNGLVSDYEDYVRIPVRLLRPIAAGWKKFTSGEPGYSLSDALKLGKSRQGEKIAQSIKTNREAFVLTFKIELIRFFSALDEVEISVEAAILDFSEKTGLSESQLKKAHSAWIEDVRALYDVLGYPMTRPS